MKSRSITGDKRNCNSFRLQLFFISRSLNHGCERNLPLALYTFYQNKIIAGYPRRRHKAYIDLSFASLSFTPIVESENLLRTIMGFTVLVTQ
ncbi:serine/threonine-protein kinase PCTAIRE-2 [Trichinella spiralis]|uniref:serine/threonine-protein kinase PCTAIRE-2 n=1 Tax=Trichinella spiralis TaxID=6334 RepID=UPI0001EFE913|nr:serine/threonine-protein kinase PCTAIRE-2 [Trichinella spiralis]